MEDKRTVGEILMEWDVNEARQTIDLYHGTCMDNAKLMVKNGWQPNKVSSGASQGQTRYLYVTNIPKNAEWFADQRGCNTVLLLKDVPISSLGVDPEDGSGKDAQDEIDGAKKFGLPAYLVVTKPLPSRNFKIHSGKY